MRQSGLHERSRVGSAQQAGLDLNAAREQQLAQRDDSGFALIRCHEVGHVRPRFDDPESFVGIRCDRRRRGEGDGSRGAPGSDRAQHASADDAIERLAAGVVERMHVHGVRANVHGRALQDMEDRRTLGKSVVTLR